MLSTARLEQQIGDILLVCETNGLNTYIVGFNIVFSRLFFLCIQYTASFVWCCSKKEAVKIDLCEACNTKCTYFKLFYFQMINNLKGNQFIKQK